MREPRVPGRFVIAGAAALTIAHFTGLALAPTLLAKAPLLLVALSPISRHLLLAATVTPFVPLLATAFVRRMLSGIFAYLMGHAYGEQGVEWTRKNHPRTGRLLTLLQRWLDRFGPLLLIAMPLPLMCGLAGVARIRLWLFLLMTATGQMMWIAATYRVGSALSHWLLPLVDFFRGHVLETTIACVIGVAIYAWVRSKAQTLPAATELPPAEPSEGG